MCLMCLQYCNESRGLFGEVYLIATFLSSTSSLCGVLSFCLEKKKWKASAVALKRLTDWELLEEKADGEVLSWADSSIYSN